MNADLAALLRYLLSRVTHNTQEDHDQATRLLDEMDGRGAADETPAPAGK